MLVVYYVMLRVHQLMHDEGEKEKNEQQKCWCSSLWRCLARLDKCFVSLLRMLGKCMDWIMEKLNLEWNEALKKYFYDFFLESFARFMFILVFQLTFDYATLSYLGHNGPEFS